MKSNSQKGVALVITLIFLSIITFMAVTFLVVSRRGSEQVTTLTQQATAKNAADAALQQANAQIMSQMFAQTNGFNFGLVVSTNFVNSNYDAANPTAITNVSYQEPNGAPLSAGHLPQMLNNLLILPRPPVFISTNKAPNASNEFRFYVDLNRNGVFDTNGVVPVLNNVGQVLQVNGTNVLTNVVGDPEWIGILDHPEQRHSASNQFVARYAFIALPIGNSLDINYVHNQAKRIGNSNDGFLRDQGVGSWEINLAGFLNALNPNPGFWDYKFYENTNLFVPSQGLAFQDAAAILQYRYGGDYNTLRSFDQLYALANPNAAALFDNDFIDGYSLGNPLMNTLSPRLVDNDPVSLNWSGADSTNHYFTTQDLFNNVPAPPGPALSFSNRLASAGKNLDTFDRYTYYRMLSQMSFESAPDSTNKLNLNYENVNGFAATNFVPWRPLDFFTSAADRLLKTHPNFIITNVLGATTIVTNLSTSYIPIYPNNFYTPAVHRMLQLAANIYDASINKTTNVPLDFDYPSVFRPTFNKTIVNGVTTIFINGYTNVSTNGDFNAIPLSLPEDLSLITANTTNIYGIPWVIGAKRGFPNFNEIAMQSTIQLQRKLEIDKKFKGNDISHWATNTQYIIAISNAVGVEAWNSYSSNYTRQIDIIGADMLTMVLTNELGTISNTSVPYPMLLTTNSWPRFPNSQSPPPSLIAASFQVPLYTNLNFVPDSVYHINGTLTPVSTSTGTGFEVTAPRYPQPVFGLNITNRLRFIMLDHASQRVIDYVQFNGMDLQRNLLQELKANDNFGPGGVWDTNRLGGSLSDQIPILGEINQVQISLGFTNISGGNPPYTPVTDTDWTDAQAAAVGFPSKHYAITNFQSFYNDTSGTIYPGLTNQVPFTPTRIISVYQTWQANDPLVHYTLSDLTGLGDLTTLPQTNYPRPATSTNLVLKNIGRVNDRYMPWNSQGSPKVGDPKYAINLALKDPSVSRSDDWQFPTNRYPNIGWLGRVHRGTPWQTVYMKSSLVDPTNWQNWSGNINAIDAATMQPTNDWAIFDLFTTAPNDNASRGQLSINQTNFAAWAAILDGVIVISNDDINGFTPLVIDPNATNANGSAVQQIVNGINAQRTTTNVFGQPLYPGQVFTRLGDVLSTPQLTVASPFLNINASVIGANALNDAAYERIPQQIMSLLRVGTPRYVIFAYGQSLKPADRSILTSGGLGILGMCTNYQITGEVATRTVVRFEPSGPINPADPYAPLNPTQNPVMPYQKNPNNQVPQIPPPRAVIENFTVLPPE